MIVMIVMTVNKRYIIMTLVSNNLIIIVVLTVATSHVSLITYSRLGKRSRNKTKVVHIHRGKNKGAIAEPLRTIGHTPPRPPPPLLFVLPKKLITLLTKFFTYME